MLLYFSSHLQAIIIISIALCFYHVIFLNIPVHFASSLSRLQIQTFLKIQNT